MLRQNLNTVFKCCFLVSPLKIQSCGLFFIRWKYIFNQVQLHDWFLRGESKEQHISIVLKLCSTTYYLKFSILWKNMWKNYIIDLLLLLLLF